MTEDLKNLAFEMQRRGIPPRYFAAQMRRGMSPQEIFAAWPSRPPSERIGTRRFRRRLVVGTYGGWLLVTAILMVLSTTVTHFPLFAFVVFLNAIVMLIWLWPRSFINREMRASDAGLDERLVQNRNLAFRTAYQVFASVALLAWPLSLAVVWYQGGTQGWTNAIVIYAGASLVATTLPIAIWAWREPDPAEPEPPTR